MDVCVLCACCARGSQKRAVDPLGSELQTVVSRHKGVSAEPSLLQLPTPAIFLQSRACPPLFQTFPAWVNHSRSSMPRSPLALPTTTSISTTQSLLVKPLILPLALAFPCRIISDLSASFLHTCVLQIVSDVLHGHWQQESIINISPLSKFYLKYNLFV